LNKTKHSGKSYKETQDKTTRKFQTSEYVLLPEIALGQKNRMPDECRVSLLLEMISSLVQSWLICMALSVKLSMYEFQFMEENNHDHFFLCSVWAVNQRGLKLGLIPMKKKNQLRVYLLQTFT